MPRFKKFSSLFTNFLARSQSDMKSSMLPSNGRKLHPGIEATKFLSAGT